MPKILSDYEGLSFYLYYGDHPPPHLHVKYGEFEGVFNIQTGEIEKGYLPPKKRKLAQKIIKENQGLLKKFLQK